MPAGLYVHIPFCKRRCNYCDFFSTTLLNRRDEYVQALLQEIEARRDEAGEAIRTIYIGGGTPSQLEPIAIHHILRAIHAPEATEVTMEVNPADLTPKYIEEIRQYGINRLSIGVQSFQDDLLKVLGRRHTAAQAIDAVHMAQKAGFDNLSIDLMYALPTQTIDAWKADIEEALRLNVQHISTYGLIYEEGTALTQRRDAGEITPIDEDTENDMYDHLCTRLQQAGYKHYEVSNVALPGYEAQHNSSYWDGTPYVGVGAGAHSYIGRERSWNPDDLEAYIQGILAHNLQREKETLTDEDLYNERVMLGLRTCRGVLEPLSDQSRANIEAYTRDNLLRRTGDGRIVATQQGLHILNRIIEDLMI